MAFLFKHPKSKYWYAGWKDENGRRINRSTKIPCKQSTRREAQKIADAYADASTKAKTARQVRETIIDLHRRVTGEEAAVSTAREFGERFIELKAGEAGEGSVAFYRRAIERFLDWSGEKADKSLESFTAHDITRYRNDLLKTIQPVTAANQLKAIKALFRLGVEEGECSTNPFGSIRVSTKSAGKGEKTERRAFKLDELRKVLQEADDTWRSMVYFGLYTGQRLGDLSTLRWSSIDLESNEIRFLTRKTGHSILMPIAQPLRDHILSLDTPDDPMAYLHPRLAESYEKSGSATLSNQFSTILARCGLREKVRHTKKTERDGAKREASLLSFHSLRATAVTLLHEAKVPASMVQEWVGHNSKEVHRRYVKHGKEALEYASAQLPDVFKRA
ncbi:tyrosine-type recombinase/integrase [Pelagicoccus enzymogenes]|uniref:tyrosine-type recombinase/integrase n=1 Tax=Pelagicoccus enzymogenes TaxID=2773457 RepID=UPI0028101AD7|nr:tyrosine-type recombinase/integrase [Pelagicoccus enzymogenes]MDQ8200695.1 tyrosine-type recombinase/integrase [Pelagicoccus enzymogenes]